MLVQSTGCMWYSTRLALHVGSGACPDQYTQSLGSRANTQSLFGRVLHAAIAPGATPWVACTARSSPRTADSACCVLALCAMCTVSLKTGICCMWHVGLTWLSYMGEPAQGRRCMWCPARQDLCADSGTARFGPAKASSQR